jgi:hypothetical protein
MVMGKINIQTKNLRLGFPHANSALCFFEKTAAVANCVLAKATSIQKTCGNLPNQVFSLLLTIYGYAVACFLLATN